MSWRTFRNWSREASAGGDDRRAAKTWEKSRGGGGVTDRLALLVKRKRRIDQIIEGSAAVPEIAPEAQRPVQVVVPPADPPLRELVAAFAVHALIRRSGPELDLKRIAAQAKEIADLVAPGNGRKAKGGQGKADRTKRRGRHPGDCSCEKCDARRKAA